MNFEDVLNMSNEELLRESERECQKVIDLVVAFMTEQNMADDVSLAKGFLASLARRDASIIAPVLCLMIVKAQREIAELKKQSTTHFAE